MAILPLNYFKSCYFISLTLEFSRNHCELLYLLVFSCHWGYVAELFLT